jgi:UDP-glucose 4-epimerase
MKKVLILGANGFIGKALCRRLAKEYKILAYDIKFSEENRNIENVEFIEGNFIQEISFEEILEGVDTIYHLISTTLPTDSTKYVQEEIIENVLPTVRLLEAMVAKQVKTIIFSSSAGTIYGEKGHCVNNVEDALAPNCSYGVQKKVIETYLEFYGLKYGINYKIARIANPYGLGQDAKRVQGVIPILIGRLLEEEEIVVYGDGSNARDYIYMEDLIEVLVKLLEYCGDKSKFNIGTGRVHSLLEIINLIEKISKKKFVKINYLPVRIHDISSTNLEVKSTFLELDWTPDTDLEQGIAKILNSMIIGRGEKNEGNHE